MSIDMERPRRYATARARFEERAQVLVGLRLAAVRYVAGVDSVGYERRTEYDLLDFGVELVGDDGRTVYVSSEFGDFNLVILDRAPEGRSVTEMADDDRWRPVIGRRVTTVEVASEVDKTPWVHIPYFLGTLTHKLLMRGVFAEAEYEADERALRPTLRQRVAVTLANAAGWIVNNIARTEPRNHYIPTRLTLGFGERRVWISAPPGDDDDEERDPYSMRVVFDERVARRLEFVV